MKILITGGTGFVGKSVARELLRMGHSLKILTRDPARARGKFPFPAEFVSGELSREILNGVEGVINLAGEGVAEKRWSGKQKKKIYDSRVQGTEALVAAVEKHNPRLKFFISASATGFYGDAGDEILLEESPGGRDFLAEVCRDWEAPLARLEKIGVRVAVLRIGVVLGRGGGLLEKLLPLVRANLAGPLGSGKQWMSWIHLADLVRLIRFSIENDGVSGVLNAVAPEPSTNRDFMRAFCQSAKKHMFAPVPRPALRIALGEMADFVLASQRAQPGRAEKLGFRFWFRKIEKAFQDCVGDLEGDEELVFEQWVPKSVQEVFPFFASEKNLEVLTPPWLNFHVLGISTPEIQNGTKIDYRLRFRGFPMRWQSRIDSWEPNKKFVDEETRGPFAKWHHTHLFEVMAGGALLTDRIRYRLYGGFLGRIAAGPFVKRDIAKIFGYRKSKVSELFA